MFRIKFFSIGRARWSDTMDVDVGTLEDAENTALIECRRHLASNEVFLTHLHDLTYEVNAGFHTVGMVKFQSL